MPHPSASTVRSVKGTREAKGHGRSRQRSTAADTRAMPVDDVAFREVVLGPLDSATEEGKPRMRAETSSERVQSPLHPHASTGNHAPEWMRPRPAWVAATVLAAATIVLAMLYPTMRQASALRGNEPTAAASESQTSRDSFESRAGVALIKAEAPDATSNVVSVDQKTSPAAASAAARAVEAAPDKLPIVAPVHPVAVGRAAVAAPAQVQDDPPKPVRAAPRATRAQHAAPAPAARAEDARVQSALMWLEKRGPKPLASQAQRP